MKIHTALLTASGFLSIFLLTSCSKEIEGTFSGIMRWGFETQSFYVDEEDEAWWVSPQKDAFDKFGEDYGLRLKQLGEEYAVVLQYKVKMKGVASKRGEYGHFGMFKRQFEVEEIVDFEWIGKDDQ
ncbi:hypothetical protein [Pelagicoccus sp. SDUM812005]|uniref:hypothetical protein n=1 Tax=Pelagicoccus sp. SDUM812005 TaxID=3041257 RepID=UPI00280C4B80|nr:hypothetical protein [Pelagicoccus sp. SDUM812005]MDQ8183893.1 hypothetical protein [Pelagicoccus sp. SDUM812005]